MAQSTEHIISKSQQKNIHNSVYPKLDKQHVIAIPGKIGT
jgi:hypothetical protein